MTSTDYFRNLALHDLEYPTDDRLLELHRIITEQFSNLKKFRSTMTTEIIYYGKSINEFILLHDNKTNTILFFHAAINKNVLYRHHFDTIDRLNILKKYADIYLGIKPTYVDWAFFKTTQIDL